MIFASDLDRTLMYSKRAIGELGEPVGIRLKPVENKDGIWVAYMTESSYFALKELSERSLFVPVTTRTTEQFNRFVIFNKDIQIDYAVTSNGANILYRGEPLEEWSQNIANRLHKESAGQDELLSIIQREGFQFDGQRKQAEKLFFYFILNTLPSASEKNVMSEIAEQYGWRISLQGKKLYFIPKAISKGNALKYICERVGRNAIAGAGDSILDWDFLQYCQYRFVPKHGELARVSGTNNYFLTANHGVYAGEEILQQFLELLPLKC